MKYSFLPIEIRNEIEASIGDCEPFCVLRSNYSMGGLSTGESFVIAFDSRVFFFTRDIELAPYKKIDAGYSEINHIEIRTTQSDTVFDLETGEKNYSLVFPKLEEARLREIENKWMVASATPISLMLAALLHVASKDNVVAEEENQYIINISEGKMDLLDFAHAIFIRQPINTLQRLLNELHIDQKCCVIANLLELAMCDGLLDKVELDIIREFSKNMNIPDDTYDNIRNILLMKNNIAVMQLKNKFF